MVYKHITKHAFFLLAAVITFSLAGHIGLLFEGLSHDLTISTTAFGISAAGIMTVLVKIYYIFIS